MISEKSASRRQKRRFRFKDVNGMSDTFRQEKLSDFTIIRNSIFKDTNLSAKAKGVVLTLCKRPVAILGENILFVTGIITR